MGFCITELVEEKFRGIMNNFLYCIMNTIFRDFKGNIQFWRCKIDTKRANLGDFLAENLFIMYFQSPMREKLIQLSWNYLLKVIILSNNGC